MKRLFLCAFMILVASLAQAAEPHKTDWFAASTYGVLVHYLEGLQNHATQIQSLGRQTAWDEYVQDFDTEKLAIAAEALRVGNPDRIIAFNNAFQDMRVLPYTPLSDSTTRDASF